MKIFVTAKPNAKADQVDQIDELHFIVTVKAPPVKGLANAAIIDLLADHFNLPKSNFKIILGYSSRQKIIEIKTKE